MCSHIHHLVSLREWQIYWPDTRPQRSQPESSCWHQISQYWGFSGEGNYLYIKAAKGRKWKLWNFGDFVLIQLSNFSKFVVIWLDDGGGTACVTRQIEVMWLVQLAASDQLTARQCLTAEAIEILWKHRSGKHVKTHENTWKIHVWHDPPVRGTEIEIFLTGIS